jgi:hypothetical protein
MFESKLKGFQKKESNLMRIKTRLAENANNRVI